MWQVRLALALIALALFSYPAPGADLTKVERTIGKLPALTSRQPEYCLLVFGPQATDRVWIVQDGGVLYVDRNGNGDLSESGERIAADPRSSYPDQGVFHFTVSDLSVGSLVHKDLAVDRSKLDHLADTDPELRAILARNPKFRACSVRVDVEMPNQRGTGIDGRVTQWATSNDDRGYLQFARQPADAPIIHFGGSWTVTLAGSPGQWRVGRKEELHLVVGTPGVGPGSMADLWYDKVIPAEISPTLEVAFPPAVAGQPPVVQSYQLTRRCCGVNLYGDVAVPDNVGAGQAKVQITLTGWPDVTVASSQHEITILPAEPRPKTVPVALSPRLVGKLSHEQPGAALADLQFTSDGKRMLARDFSTGLVNVWDLATGKRFSRIEAGAKTEDVSISPDGQTVYTLIYEGGEYQKTQRDGQPLRSVHYQSSVRSWHIDGTPLKTYEHWPSHGILGMRHSPDGKYFLTVEEVPREEKFQGEFDTGRPRSLTLWDTSRSDSRRLAEGNEVPVAFSAGGKLVAVTRNVPDDYSHQESVAIFAAPEWKEIRRVPFQSILANAFGPFAFLADDRVLMGQVQINEQPNDWRHYSTALKFWDVATGKELFSIPCPLKGHSFGRGTTSPDGKMVVLTLNSQQPATAAGRLLLVDVAARTSKFVDLPQVIYVGRPVFDPTGQWIAVYATSKSSSDAPTNSVQARIEILNPSTGQIVETLMPPQTSLSTVEISPDGKTLATTVASDILLWDFHRPPGALSQPLEKRLGQPLEIVGQTADGAAFDRQSLRGKVVLVDFWATWCAACVAEMPHLKSLSADLRTRGFEVVGVSLDDNPAAVAQFVRDQVIPWPMLCQRRLEGSTDIAADRHPLSVIYGVETLPTTFLIGRDGKIAAVNVPRQQLRAKIEALLEAK